MMQINNAGSNAYSYKPLAEASDEDLMWASIQFSVPCYFASSELYKLWALYMQRSCNYKHPWFDDMLSRGSFFFLFLSYLACLRPIVTHGCWLVLQAIKMMLNQPRGGHIFNIDGAGSDGRPTPRYLLLVYSSITNIPSFSLLQYLHHAAAYLLSSMAFLVLAWKGACRFYIGKVKHIIWWFLLT